MPQDCELSDQPLLVVSPTATGTNNIRQEASSSWEEGSSSYYWQEHFVDVAEASLTANVGAAVWQSLSYVTIPNFGTLDELSTLQESALSHQASCDRSGDDGDGDDQQQQHHHHVMGASQVNFNCTRYSVERLLDDNAKTVSATFLHRLLELLQNDKDLLRIFESRKFTSSLADLEATWYAEPDDKGVLHPEPKVNIYQEGGYFKQHTDGMQLTLLVVLNDAFEGGGTAFFAGQEEEEVDEEQNEEAVPRAFDKRSGPAAGTAIIWGADLLHMALPVTTGMRAVYVGSFDLNERDAISH